MTTVTDFVGYYLRRLWREGDQDLTDDLPRLVKEAEARISRDIRENNLVHTEIISSSAPDTHINLPADFNELVSVSFDGGPPSTLIEAAQLSRYRSVTPHDENLSVFSIQGNKLWFLRGAAIYDYSVAVTYHMKPIPATMHLPDSDMVFYDLHPDFFLAALDVQTYAYLREYDLSGEKNSVYTNLIETMVRQSNYAQWPSGQLNPWKRPTEYKTATRNTPVTPTGTDYVAIYEAGKNA